MKKVFFLIGMFLFCVFTLQAQIVKESGWLKVEGTQLCDSKNHPIVLRGASFGWHMFHPRFYNADAVKWLHKDWHCSILRAAMGIEPEGGYLQDSTKAINLIEKVVDACIQEGIYVIIDWHSHHVNLYNATHFFELMAKKYGRTPNVIFELFNEPAEAQWPEIKQYAETIIPIIRKHAPRNIILVGCPKWDQEIDKPANDPIKGFNNIMYTVHYYAGTHKQWLRDRANEALRKGLPIFISESGGMDADGNGSLNMEEWKDWIEWSEINHISWLTYSISDKKETCSMLLPSSASTGGWKEKDLNESGQQTRKFLRNYNLTKF